MQKHKLTFGLISILAGLIVYYLFMNFAQNPKYNGTLAVDSGGKIEARVISVIDGDTIDVDAGGKKYTVRYIGIDTPETVKPNTKVECYGKEASSRNRELVENEIVLLEHDADKKDSYGRELRYVYLKESNTLINQKLVEEGYAEAKSYPPNTRHQKLLDEAEADARNSQSGMWGQCK